MAKLRQPQSRLMRAQTSRVRVPVGRAETEAWRNAQAWRKWYNTARWRQLRFEVLVRDLFTCGMCGAIVTGKGMAVADHRRPHRGNAALFWDPANIWCLCKPCHDGAKAREEAQRY